MPAHIYVSKLYDIYSHELRELITELSREYKRLEEEEDEEEEVKYVRLVKNNDHRIVFVFMRVGQNYILHYIEVSALYEDEYKRIVEEIRNKIKIFSVGWI
jgi:RNA processing factor Prp31